MNVYTFNITSLKKKTINDIESVIFNVVWEKVGYDPDGHRGTYKISTQLDTSQVGVSSSFVTYENLTKQDVVNWIKASTDEDMINAYIESEIQDSRDNLTIVTENSMPWD